MTEDLKARLRAWSGTPFDDDAHQAADYIEQIEETAGDNFFRGMAAGQQALKDIGKLVMVDSPELAELRLALTQSRAETAAAYDLAASMVKRLLEADDYYSPTDIVFQLQALATPDQTAALDAVRAEARAQSMREAELRVMRIAAGLFPGGFDNNFQKISDAVAAIKGAKA